MAKSKDSVKGTGVKGKAAGPHRGVKGRTRADEVAEIFAPSEAEYLKSREDGTHKEATLDILSFYLNEDIYAIEVEHIGSVIMSRENVGLPHMPEFIDGLISVRGEMILVMNLKRRLGIDKNSSLSGNIIVTEPSSTGNKTGMIVDRMAGVTEVAGLLKEPVKAHKGKKGAPAAKEQGFDFIKGIVENDAKQPIKVLDMDKLMAFDMPAGVA